MQHIHWLGAGLSSVPGIRRLATKYNNFTIWNRTLEKAQHSINHVNKDNVIAKKLDINVDININNKLFRHDEMDVEFGSYNKVQNLLSWSPQFTLEEGLINTIENTLK